MSFMEYDSPISTIINKTLDIFVLSVLWFVCCLPIITIGASTTALYYSSVKVIRRNKGYAAKNFFHAFRTNFFPATLLWLFFGVLAVVLYICFVFAAALPDDSLRFLMTTVYLFMSFVILGMGCFAFPVLSRCSMKCGAILKFSFGLLVKHFPLALIMIVIVVAAAVVMWYVPLFTFCVPAAATMFFSFPAESVLLKYTPENERSRYMDE